MDFSSIISGLSSSGVNSGLKSWVDTGINTGLSLLGRSDAKKAADEDRKYNAWQAQLNRDFQKQERLETQEYNVAFWNLNNQYNERLLAEQREYDSPEAQIQRALQAGINPNTIVGGIDGNSANYSASSPISSSPMSGNAASYSSGLPSALTNLWSNIALQTAQIRNINADTDKKESETKGQNIQNDWDNASFDERLRSVTANTDKVLRDIKNVDFTEEETRKMNEWVARHTQAQIDEINKRLVLLDNTIALEAEKLITERKNQNYIDAQTEATNSNKAYTDIQKQVYDEIYKQEKIKTAFAEATEVPIGSSDWHVMYKLWKERKFSDLTKVGLYSSSDKYIRGVTSLVNRVEDIESSIADKIKSLYNISKNMISTFNPDMKSLYKYRGNFGRSIR